MNDDEPNAARNLLDLLFKRFRRIAIFTVAAATAAYVLISADGAQYSATARVLITPTAPVPELSASSFIVQEHGVAARNEAEILRDPALIRALLPTLKTLLRPRKNLFAHVGAWWRDQFARIGLTAPETQDQMLAERFTHALNVSVVKDTDVVALRFTWADPAFAAKSLNALLAEQKTLQTAQDEAKQAVILAQTRLRDARTQLARLDTQIGASASSGSGAIEREKERIAGRIAAAQSNANALHLERDLVAHRLEAADTTYKGGGWVDDPDAPASTSGPSAMDPAFVDLLGKRQKLLEHLAPDNPRVQTLDQQIAQARAHAYDRARAVFGARLKTLDENLSAIDTQNAADRASIGSLDEHLIDSEALHRSRDAAFSQVSEAARRAEEASRQANPALHDTAFRILSQAVAPAEPDWPSPALVLGLATLFGFGAGIASAVRAERSMLTIDRRQDITRLLQIPVLASVPELR